MAPFPIDFMKRSILLHLTAGILTTAILLSSSLLLSGCTKAPAQTELTSSTEPITTSSPPRYDPTTQTEPVSVTYLVSGQGKLAGNTEQTLTPEAPFAGKVEAIPDLGYRFSHWSDGSTDPLRLTDSFAVDTVLTAYFVIEHSNLPAVCLTTEISPDQITTEQYVNGSISISGCDADLCITDLEAEIRGRGHGSWTYAKKGWKLKLSSGQSLLDLGKGKSREWVLIANHIDRSLLRNAAATWIQNQLDLIWAPDYAFVDLYLNGEYMGVYQLYEQIEEDEHKVSIPHGTPEDVSYFAELTTHAEDPWTRVDDKKYAILSDLPENDSNAYFTAIIAHLRACYDAVESGDYDAIHNLINLPSVVDAYIVEELTKNLDSGWDSFYLYRLPGGKLSFGPVWDFDLSSGNAEADSTSICFDTFPSPEELYSGNTEADDRQLNPWFQLLMKQDWFVELVKARWQEVSPRLAELPDLIRKTGETYEDAFARNFMRWKIMGKRLSKDSDEVVALLTYEQQLDYLVSWYRARIHWLNEAWDA